MLGEISCVAMLAPAPPSADLSLLFIEVGAATLGLAFLSRVANRVGVSAVPFYLLAGLAFGNGGLAPLPFSSALGHVGAEIGVVLLLFALGLEYSGGELLSSMRSGVLTGVVDLVLNFAPGLLLGIVLGWPASISLAFGGITYVSSSGVIAKVLADLGREDEPETSVIVSVLVLEDLAMAVYLPLLTVALSSSERVVLPLVIAIVTVAIVLIVAVRFGRGLTRIIAHKSNEIILLTCFGAVLLVAGVAQRLQVSAAVGAFLVGIALSGPVAEHARRVIAPVRDLFADVFFFFFGLQIAPAELLPVLPLAAGLAAFTAATKYATGMWAAQRGGFGNSQQRRVGATLIARGEFSIVTAGLAATAGASGSLNSLAAGYVLLTAVAGPVAARFMR